ncbi:MAG: hypothetical protein WCT07_00190 [Candidatus Paceibacterota bacterium]|jgi:NMD protein affecting ribosome stability and mRNA decay
MSNIFSRIAGSVMKHGRDYSKGEDHLEYKGVTECPKCHNVRFEKRWLHSIADLRKEGEEEPIVARTEKCPACKIIDGGNYEGELFVEGFREEQKEELLNLIHNYCARATEIDPQDRVIKIEDTEKGLRITTVENELTDRLAKKIKDAFNHVNIHFSHGGEGAEADRVRVTFEN